MTNYRILDISSDYAIIEIDLWLQKNFNCFLYSTHQISKNNESYGLSIYGYDMSYQLPSYSYGLSGHHIFWETVGWKAGWKNETYLLENALRTAEYARNYHHNEERAQVLESMRYHSREEHEQLYKAIKRQFGRKKNDPIQIIQDLSGNFVDIKSEFFRRFPGGRGTYMIFTTYDILIKLRELYGENEVDDFGRRKSML